MDLIHTDLKPENILAVCREEIIVDNGSGHRVAVPATPTIKVIDFGGATYDNDHKSSIVNTRQYRAPEVILGLGWGFPSDIWSIGCIAAELYHGELLFATHSNTEHIALMQARVGPFPARMVEESPFSGRYFDSSGRSRTDALSHKDAAHVRKTVSLSQLVDRPEDADFLELLRGLLVLDARDRLSAESALRRCP